MKLKMAAVGALALMGLGACGSPVDGVWCPSMGDGKLTLKGGKVTSTESKEGGTYKVSGKEVTLTEDSGRSMSLTIEDKDTLAMTNTPMKFTRCK